LIIDEFHIEQDVQLFGKGSLVEPVAIEANLSLRLMFECFHFDRQQVEYLTPFITYGFCIAQRPTACFVFGDQINDHMIWFIRHFESMSLMPFLTAYGFSTRLSPAFYLTTILPVEFSESI
jgi:hypothetical protein